MGAVQILINQPGKPPGVAGRAREDLALGVPVNLSATGGTFFRYQWTMVWRPVDVLSGVRSACVLASPDQALTQLTPLDVPSTYFVEVAVDSGNGLGASADDVARITLYAGPLLASDPRQFPRRPIAVGETVEHNVPDLVDPLGNADGWARERARYDLILQTLYQRQRLPALYATLSAPHVVPAVGADAEVSLNGVEISTYLCFSPPSNGRRIVLVGEATLITTGGGNFWWGVVNSEDDTDDYFITNLGGPGACAPGTTITATGVLIAAQ